MEILPGNWKNLFRGSCESIRHVPGSFENFRGYREIHS